jgi:uncharacterized repeat protein (TIGR01451 family)
VNVTFSKFRLCALATGISLSLVASTFFHAITSAFDVTINPSGKKKRSRDHKLTLTIISRLFSKALLFAMILSLLFPVFLSPQPAQADRVGVMITIDRIQEIIDPDNGPFQGDGDYYVDVKIGDRDRRDSRAAFIEWDDFMPQWRFSEVVERATIPINIRLWDIDDEATLNWDDIQDISRRDGKVTLDLNLDLRTGMITSNDLLDIISSSRIPGRGQTQTTIMSEGDDDRASDEHPGFNEGGEPARIWFTISFSPTEPSPPPLAPVPRSAADAPCNPSGGIPADRDTDGDFIPDRIEICGIFDGNGRNQIVNMAALGADPCRKTIAIEIDYMANAATGRMYRPSPQAIDQIIKAFNVAPVDAVQPPQCPYPGFPRIPAEGNPQGGVNLIIDPNSPRNTIPESNQPITVSDFQQIMNQNFQPERRPFFHYSLGVHRIQEDTEAGTLTHGGYMGLLTTPEDFAVSMRPETESRKQAATLMHELGHALGLKHGGNDDINCKPNYLSIMSSTFVAVGGIPTADLPRVDGRIQYKLDYSRQALPTLDERSLREPLGIQDGGDYTIWGFPLAGPLERSESVGLGNGPLNWDLSRNVIDTDRAVSADINYLSLDDCGYSPGQPALTGFNDWAALNYIINRNIPGFTPIGGVTFADAERLSQIVDAYFNLQPKITISSSPDNSTGKAVFPGQTITYTATVENLGKLPARQVEIMNVFPDSTNETRMIFDIAPGGSVTEQFNYTLPTVIVDPIILNDTIGFTEAMSPRIPDIYKDPKALATTVSMPVNVNMTNEDLLVAQNLTSDVTLPHCINCNGDEEDMARQFTNKTGHNNTETPPAGQPSESEPAIEQEKGTTTTAEQGTSTTTPSEGMNITDTTKPDDSGGGGFFEQ